MADPRALRRLALAAVLAVLVVVIAVLLLRRGRPTRQAILALPADERVEMFSRAMADLRLCEERADPRLRDTCRERAEFLLLFPECDEACRERAGRFLPKATR